MKLPTSQILDAFGVALAYPRGNYRATVAACARDLTGTQAAEPLETFRRAIDDLDAIGLEGLYTSTFDLNPVATLEVGWHLFGEQYRRGRFLVHARELLAIVGIDEGGELPDHLMSLLPALGRIETKEAAVLATLYVLPAIDKINSGLADKDNPFEYLLTAVRRVLEPLAAEVDELPAPSIVPSDLIQIGIPRHRQSTEKGAVS